MPMSCSRRGPSRCCGGCSSVSLRKGERDAECGVFRSAQRGVQLLARLALLVSERQRAYQRKVQGAPVRCNASFGCILRRAAAPRRLLVRANQPTTQLRCSWARVRGAGPQRATKSKRGPAPMVPAARDLE